tara:strand:+ start:37 stop:720 length:684 start_codon:yes stop_codon:yes gene_type:complete
MKKLLLLSALLIFACTDDEGNPCIYEPTLSTEAVTDISETSATLNGVISIVSENCDIALGGMQGFVYSTNPSPTNDDNVEVVYGTDISTTIDNLIPNTTYYVRVFITNSLGDFYGDEISFSTTDITCDAVQLIATQTLCLYDNAQELTVSYVGGVGSPTYQWYVSDTCGTTGIITPISLSTSSSFTPPTSALGVFYYFAELVFYEGSCGVIVSDCAEVEVVVEGACD